MFRPGTMFITPHLPGAGRVRLGKGAYRPGDGDFRVRQLGDREAQQHVALPLRQCGEAGGDGTRRRRGISTRGHAMVVRLVVPSGSERIHPEAGQCAVRPDLVAPVTVQQIGGDPIKPREWVGTRLEPATPPNRDQKCLAHQVFGNLSADPAGAIPEQLPGIPVKPAVHAQRARSRCCGRNAHIPFLPEPPDFVPGPAIMVVWSKS